MADPWPLCGDSDYPMGQQPSAQTDKKDAGSESWVTMDEIIEKTVPAAATGDDDDDDADIDDIVNQSPHQDMDEDGKEAGDCDGDDVSDLYPGYF